MPCDEYITGYYQSYLPSESGKIKIVKNDLPDTLKSEVTDALFEAGFTASQRRRCLKWLKKITIKAEYGSKIPLPLVTIDKSEANRRDSPQIKESEQQVVAVYYRLYPERCYIPEIYVSPEDMPSLERQEQLAGWLKALGHLSESSIEGILNGQFVAKKPSISVSKLEVSQSDAVKPQIIPESDIQEQGSYLAQIATLILARRKQTQLQLEHFAIQYDSQRGQIKVENQWSHQSILVADHEQNYDKWVVPDNWNVDRVQTEITDDFVRQLLDALSESESLIATRELTDSNQTLEDVRSLERLVSNTNKRLHPNSMLATKAIKKGYKPERIKQILLHTDHTKSLCPESARQSIEDAYELAVAIKQNWPNLAFDLDSEPTDSVTNRDTESFCPYIGKIDVSITDMVIGLLRESSTASVLKSALCKFDLAISYSAKLGVYTIYKYDDPYQEYVAACSTDSGIKIVSDHLPLALKKEIFAELLKIEIPHWLPDYFDHLKFLKHRALRKGENHYHPFALVSVVELRTENEPQACDFAQGFEQVKELAATQELVATYDRTKPNSPTELDSAIEPIDVDAFKLDSDDDEVVIAETSDNLLLDHQQPKSHQPKLSKAVKRALKSRLEVINQRMKLNSLLASFTVVKSNSYLESVGVEVRTLLDSRFAGTILANKSDVAIFPHQNQEGITGYEGIAENFNRFSKNGTESLWQSNFTDGDRHLVIVECPIDALAHYQLHQEPQTRYIALGKNPNSTQIALVGDMAQLFIRQGKRVTAATNNDLAGEQISQQISTLFSLGLIKRAKPKKLTWRQDMLEKRKFEQEKDQNSSVDKLFSRLNQNKDCNVNQNKSVNQNNPKKGLGYGE